MVDRLSDRGFLSFTDDLKIIVRKGSHSPSLAELLAEIEGNQAKAATLLPELKNTVIRDQLESNAVDLIRRRICFKRTRLHFLGVSDRSSLRNSIGPVPCLRLSPVSVWFYAGRPSPTPSNCFSVLETVAGVKPRRL